MARNRLLARMILTHLRLRFLVALGGLAVLCAGLTLLFLVEWHREGNQYAIALGELLTFFASILTAAVTLTYLHVSRRALAAAEAATALQREQWEARITVLPRFWMGIRPAEETERYSVKPLVVTYRRDRPEDYRKGSGQHYYDSVPWPRIAVDVWNDGERSLRIGGYRLWVREEERLAIEKPLYGFVVPPNELRTFPVTEDLIALSVRQRKFEERYERLPCEETVVGLRLYYSDWREDHRSSRDDYYLLLAPPLAQELRIHRMDGRS